MYCRHVLPVVRCSIGNTEPVGLHPYQADGRIAEISVFGRKQHHGRFPFRSHFPRRYLL